MNQYVLLYKFSRIPSGVAMRICILGAGITGLTTAYNLSSQGFDVLIIDQEAQPAMGASYANGAQLSVSNAIPTAHPSVFVYLLESLFKHQGGLFFKMHLSWDEWRWIYHFLRNCRRTVSEANLTRLAEICVRSRELYYQLLEQTDINFDFSKKGILHFYVDKTAYEIAARQAALLKQVSPSIRQTVNREQIVEIEPALKTCSENIVGGFYSPEDATGDARLFCLELKRLCKAQGVEFLFNTSVQNLKLGSREVIVQTDQGDFNTNHTVCCLGVHSSVLLKKIGISLNIYPLKGYSITIDLADAASRLHAPKVSLLDDQYKLVASRLGQRLRIAGIAELDDYNVDINPKRVAYLKQWVRAFMPEISINQYTEWAGLRPATPSNLPYVGNMYHQRLWLNTGHGTLGWTAAMATAETVCNAILDC